MTIITYAQMVAALKPVKRGFIKEVGWCRVSVSVPLWRIYQARKILKGKTAEGVQVDVVSLGFFQHFTQWRLEKG